MIKENDCHSMHACLSIVMINGVKTKSQIYKVFSASLSGTDVTHTALEKMWRLYPTGAPDRSHSLSFVLSLGRDMLTEADSVSKGFTGVK